MVTAAGVIRTSTLETESIADSWYVAGPDYGGSMYAGFA